MQKTHGEGASFYHKSNRQIAKAVYYQESEAEASQNYHFFGCPYHRSLKITPKNTLTNDEFCILLALYLMLRTNNTLALWRGLG